jgi:enoyl-[acyl-carrier-protein] reductase (NADH)
MSDRRIQVPTAQCSPGRVKARVASGIRQFDELLKRAAQRAPARHLVGIEDIGVATVFQASDSARPIAGERPSMSAANTTSSDGSALR